LDGRVPLMAWPSYRDSARPGRARLVLLGTAGVVLGHTIAYALIEPDGRTRAALLRSTGHAYWNAAVTAAVVAGAWSAVAHVVRSVRPDPQPTDEAETGLRAWTRLAAFQLGVFTVMEGAERLAAHQPVAPFFTHHVFFIGAAVQLVVAVVLVQALRLLGTAASALAAAIRRAQRRRPSDRPTGPPALTIPRSAASPWSCGSRAPPALAVLR
jgi:hypothetical protein